MGRLIVVSNRVATPTETKGSAGGLAVGVFGALKDAGGVWFGWSGDVVSETVANAGPTLDQEGAVTFATRHRRAHAQGLRSVLSRLFERDAVAGLPLSKRPRTV
jgi:trehalose-6-phosphate synthase